MCHLSVPGVVFTTVEAAQDEPQDEVNYCALVPGMITSDQGISVAVTHGLELMAASDVIIIPAWSDPADVASAQLIAALQLANTQGKLIVGLCLGAFVRGDAVQLWQTAPQSCW